MKRLATPFLFLLLLTIPATLAQAQITITQTELQNILVNSERMSYFITYFPYPTINLGAWNDDPIVIRAITEKVQAAMDYTGTPVQVDFQIQFWNKKSGAVTWTAPDFFKAPRRTASKHRGRACR